MSQTTFVEARIPFLRQKWESVATICSGLCMTLSCEAGKAHKKHWYWDWKQRLKIAISRTQRLLLFVHPCRRRSCFHLSFQEFRGGQIRLAQDRRHPSVLPGHPGVCERVQYSCNFSSCNTTKSMSFVAPLCFYGRQHASGHLTVQQWRAEVNL